MHLVSQWRSYLVHLEQNVFYLNIYLLTKKYNLKIHHRMETCFLYIMSYNSRILTMNSLNIVVRVRNSQLEFSPLLND